MRHTATALALALAFAACPAAAEEPPQAVTVARTTIVPDCTLFVDAASSGGNGTAQNPHQTIAAAVEATKPGAIICVAEGTYAEELKPGEKYFTLAGGFQSGKDFKIRDSAAYVSKAVGKGGSFLRIEDPGPTKDQLTAIDGFEISGYSQAVVRDYWESQRFDVTNNFIHDNICADETLAGAGAALVNVSGTIKGNVFSKNSCGRGGAVFLNDSTNQNSVSIENNLIDGNAGTEPDGSHGGAFYLFGNTLKITGNIFTNNSVTQWGAGLYVGAYTPGNQPTTATISWNIYRGNRAGDSGGGFFCDDGATCIASHEVYDGNCGGNVLLDGGAGGSDPTRAAFDHVTNVGALEVGCGEPGIGVFVDTYEGLAADSYSFKNSIFWGNAPGKDFATSCGSGCDKIKVDVAYSLLDKKYAQDGGINITFGAGVIDSADPLFVDAAKGDFHLRPGSTAIGKGSGGSDLGAYGEGSGTSSDAAPAPAEKTAAPAPADASPEQEAPAKAASEPAKETPEAATESAAETEAPAGADDLPVKEAFAAAKELGTVEAWNAFLRSYPAGFHADLARAYLKQLGD